VELQIQIARYTSHLPLFRTPLEPIRMRNRSRIQISIPIYPLTTTIPSLIPPALTPRAHDKADPHPNPTMPKCTLSIQTFLSPGPHRPLTPHTRTPAFSLPHPPARSRTPGKPTRDRHATCCLGGHVNVVDKDLMHVPRIDTAIDILAWEYVCGVM
jgi:hypothetical protein